MRGCLREFRFSWTFLGLGWKILVCVEGIGLVLLCYSGKIILVIFEKNFFLGVIDVN